MQGLAQVPEVSSDSSGWWEVWRVLSRKWSAVICAVRGASGWFMQSVLGGGRQSGHGGAFHMVQGEMEVGRQGPGEK